MAATNRNPRKYRRKAYTTTGRPASYRLTNLVSHEPQGSQAVPGLNDAPYRIEDTMTFDERLDTWLEEAAEQSIFNRPNSFMGIEELEDEDF